MYSEVAIFPWVKEREWEKQRGKEERDESWEGGRE